MICFLDYGNLRRLLLHTRTCKQLKQVICTRSSSIGPGPPNLKTSQKQGSACPGSCTVPAPSLSYHPRPSPPLFHPYPSQLPALRLSNFSLPAYQLQLSNPPALQPNQPSNVLAPPAFQPSCLPTLQPSRLPAFFQPSSLSALSFASPPAFQPCSPPAFQPPPPCSLQFSSLQALQAFPPSNPAAFKPSSLQPSNLPAFQPPQA